jgi:hypothetical protein
VTVGKNHSANVEIVMLRTFSVETTVDQDKSSLAEAMVGLRDTPSCITNADKRHHAMAPVNRSTVVKIAQRAIAVR